jgi:hypothetical protein
MAVVLRGVTTGSGNLGGNPQPAKPAGTVQGDVLVAWILTTNGAGNAPANPSVDWVDVPGVIGADQRLSYLVAGASEPSTYLWDTPGIAMATVILAAFGGVDTSDPIAEFSQLALGANPGNVDIPSLNATAAYLFEMVEKMNNAANTWTPPSGISEDADGQLGGALTYNYAAGHATVPNGAIGTQTWDPTNTSNNNIAGVAFTLNPTPVNATVTGVPAATASAEAKVPDLAWSANPLPPAAAASALSPVPTPVASNGVTGVPVATAFAQALSADLSWGAVLFPPAAQATALAPVPTYRSDWTVAAPTALATAAAYFATVVADSQVLDPQGVAVAQAYAPEISADANVEAVTATATAEALEAGYTFELNGLVIAPTATAFGLNPTPAVSATASIAAAVAQATALAIAPEVAATARVVTPRAMATASGLTPVVSASADLLLSPALAAAWANTPRINYVPYSHRATAREVRRTTTIRLVPRTISVKEI